MSTNDPDAGTSVATSARAPQQSAGTTSTAKAPAASPAAVTTGLLLAVLLLAVAAVLVQAALVSAGAVSGTAWIDGFVEKAAVLSASSPWMLWAGPLAVVIGVVLLVAALKPRKATHWSVGDQGVYIGRADAARLAANAALGAPAVVEASASVAGRNQLRVSAATIATDTSAVTGQVDDAARRRLASITPTPTIRARVTPKGD